MERRKDLKTREAVEEALQRRDIHDLTKAMEEGFAGVHKRQDEANSKTAKNVEAIGELKTSRAFLQGGLAVVSVLVVPILIYIITHWK